MPRSPAMVSIGSPGTRRMRKNATSVIPMKVGTIRLTRVRMKRSMSRIHSSSWPGSSRPSTSFLAVCAEKEDVDARHKAGHDETAKGAALSEPPLPFLFLDVDPVEV